MPTTREREMAARVSDLRHGRQNVQGRYDVAQTTDNNSRHWANADALSANAENNPQVCRTLRMRSRYELANNSYYQAMAVTLANSTIGTGPRLILNTPNVAANQYVERLWNQWSLAVRLAAKLRVAVISRCVDGAAIAVKSHNPGLAHAVKLDIRMRDYDRLATPDLAGPTATQIDGIKFDSYGNPVEYHLLKDHPGGDLITGRNPNDYDTIAARHVCHLFRTYRPEQERGRPETTPALPLFAQSRRYTLAVLRAAEMAAEIAGVIRTNSSAMEPDEVEAMDAIEIEMGHLLTLPRGWDISPMKSEHPTTTYPEFKRELLAEIGRSVLMPPNVITGDSSRHNYASGRLDQQGFHTALMLDRQDVQTEVLDPLFVDFMGELALLNLLPETPAIAASHAPPPVRRLQDAGGYLGVLGQDSVADWLKGTSDTSPTIAEVAIATRALKAGGYGEEAAMVLSIAHEWGWDGQRHVDRAKEAKGQDLELGSATTTRRREMTAANVDLDTADDDAAETYAVTRDIYRQAVFLKRFPEAAPLLGLTPAPAPPAAADEEDEDEDEVQALAASIAAAPSEVRSRIEELVQV